MTPRAITGLGVVCSLGIGRDAFFGALSVGSRADPSLKLSTLDRSKYPGARVVEALAFDAAKYLGDKGLRTLDRLSKLLIVAARLSLRDGELKKDGRWVCGTAERTGMVVSNAYGSLEAITELDRVALLEDPRYINPSRFPLTVSNSAAGYASIWEDLRALNVSVSDGNPGALDAVSCADMLLEEGRADALLVGGAEAMSEPLLVAFERLGADFAIGEPLVVSTREASAKASARTEGCLGEAAALVVLETPEHARERGAAVLAEVTGYGTSFEPPPASGTLVHASPDALNEAIGMALADADVSAADVDFVISGLSGLRPFDTAELSAISSALGPDVCVVAPKLAFGETLGAGGAMGVATALATFAYEPLAVAATNYAVRGSPRLPPRVALVTSLGYYGNASALVVRSASR